jgi:hypothetical protein
VPTSARRLDDDGTAGLLEEPESGWGTAGAGSDHAATNEYQ